jgi:hypothetical protein
MDLPLSIVQNHLFLAERDGLALVDTGSQIDLRRPSPILDVVREHTGVDLARLVGFDSLRERSLLLDWTAGVARWGATLEGGRELPVDLKWKIPLIRVDLDGSPRTAVLDSGAALSYGPRVAIGHDGEVEDFHPTIGGFRTRTRRVSVGVAGAAFDLVVGELPQSLADPVGRISDGWIIGSDLFKDRRVLVDYPRRRVVLG